jgi:hypothetical protein
MQIVDLGEGDWTPASLRNRWADAGEKRIDAECLVAANVARLVLPARPANILIILREVATKTPDEKFGVTQVRALPCERAGREVAYFSRLQTEAAAIYGEETANDVGGDQKERRRLPGGRE